MYIEIDDLDMRLARMPLSPPPSLPPPPPSSSVFFFLNSAGNYNLPEEAKVNSFSTDAKRLNRQIPHRSNTIWQNRSRRGANIAYIYTLFTLAVFGVTNTIQGMCVRVRESEFSSGVCYLSEKNSALFALVVVIGYAIRLIMRAKMHCLVSAFCSATYASNLWMS